MEQDSDASVPLGLLVRPPAHSSALESDVILLFSTSNVVVKSVFCLLFSQDGEMQRENFIFIFIF